MSRLITLFGKAGAGKDTVAEILAKRYGYTIWSADDHFSESYRTLAKLDRVATQTQRDAECERFINLIDYSIIHEAILLPQLD